MPEPPYNRFLKSYCPYYHRKTYSSMHEQLKEGPAQGLTTTDKLRMLLDIPRKISRSLDLQEVLICDGDS